MNEIELLKLDISIMERKLSRIYDELDAYEVELSTKKKELERLAPTPSTEGM